MNHANMIKRRGGLTKADEESDGDGCEDDTARLNGWKWIRLRWPPSQSQRIGILVAIAALLFLTGVARLYSARYVSLGSPPASIAIATPVPALLLPPPSNLIEEKPVAFSTPLYDNGGNTASHSAASAAEPAYSEQEATAAASISKQRTLAPRERAEDRLRRRPTEQFLLVLNVAEGMTSWYHALIEALILARKLHRTFVEPCVRDGRIVTCIPGKVFNVPYGTHDADVEISADVDPLSLPAVGDSCDDVLRGLKRAQPTVAVAALAVAPDSVFPLHAYLNMSALRAMYRPWIRFDDWWEMEMLRNDGQVVHRGSSWVVPLGYCGGKTGEGTATDPTCLRPTGPFSVAPFRFDRVHAQWKAEPTPQPEVGRPEQQHLKQSLELLRKDDARNMYFFNFWRGSVAPVESFVSLPAFNSIHHAAVRAWITARVPRHLPSGKRRFVAFQWRSETIGDHALDKCVGQLANVARDALRGAVQAGTLGHPYGGIKSNSSGGGGRKWSATRTAAAVGAAGAEEEGEGARRLRKADAVQQQATRKRAALSGTSTGSGGTGWTVNPGRHMPGVLIADMPAPNNQCKLWSVYDSSLGSDSRTRVAKLLQRVGLAKYDADHPRLDSGVLSIRDFILATEADWLVTCRGKSAADCRGCFRANSYFTKKIVEARTAAGRRSITNWFAVSAGDFVVADADGPVISAPALAAAAAAAAASDAGDEGEVPLTRALFV